MKQLFTYFRIVLTIGFLSLLGIKTKAQCPELYDGNGVLTDTPRWLSCFAGNYTLVIQSDQSIGAYDIDWGDGNTSSGASLVPPANVSHLYAATVDTFVVTFTETSSGCVITGVVVMEEPANASIQIPFGGLTSACAPKALDFVNQSTDASETTRFIWDFGDGSPQERYNYTNFGQTITHTYERGTVDCETTVTLWAENYCNTSQGGASQATFNPIRIWDLDEAAIDASETMLCYPDTEVTLSNTTVRNCFAQGNIFQRQEYWNMGDYWGLGHDSIIDWTPWPPTFPHLVQYPGVGTYQAMLIDSNYCGQDTAYIDITIVAPPFAVVTATKDTICEGESVTFINSSGGGANSYQWNFGQGGGWQNLGAGNKTQTFNTTGDYTISLMASIAGAAGCSDIATVDIYVKPSPTAAFLVDNNDGCDTLTTTFTDTSVDAISWDWDFDNGNTFSGQNPPSQFYGAPGTYDVELLVTGVNSCQDSYTGEVLVHQTPTVSFTSANVCVNSTATFTNSSTSSTDPITSQTWAFGDGNTSGALNPTNTYLTDGPFDVTLTVNTDYCSSVGTGFVTVMPKPLSDFSVDILSGCTPLDVAFTNLSTGSTSYEWDFDDASLTTTFSPSHTFTNATAANVTYTVQLISESAFGCQDTSYEDIIVFAAASASFTHNGVTGCAPMDVDFTNTSTGASGYDWYFGDGSTSNAVNPSHQYVNNTFFIEIFDILLAVESSNGCVDTAETTLTVYPQLSISFTPFPDSGCSPLSVTFPPTVGAVVWEWDFGDGNTSNQQTPTHTFVNTTTNNLTYDVELITTSPFGCKDTSVNQVIVKPSPTANFTMNKDIGCEPLVVTFENFSIGATSYNWDFGDGSTSSLAAAVFNHTFTNVSSNPINYEIALTATTTAGCSNVFTDEVTVYPPITAGFFMNPTSGCHPLLTNITEQASGEISYYYDFGDGTGSVQPNVSHTFQNNGTSNVTYDVKQVVTSMYGCRDSITQTVTVFPKPTSQFSLSANEGCHPFVLGITNTSIASDSYDWDLDDGNTSDTSAVFFEQLYTNTSPIDLDKEITLYVSTTNGCKDTSSKTITVFPEIIASFTSITTGCHPLPVSFDNTSDGASEYIWDFGDGDISIAENPSHTFNNNSNNDVTFDVNLYATSDWGCKDTAETQVLVYAKPTAQFSTNANADCHPFVVTTNNQSNIADSVFWDFGDGFTTDTAALNFNHTYVNTGSIPLYYLIKLYATTDNNCSDTTQQLMTVYPFVEADFNIDSAGCSPFTPVVSNNSINTTIYAWDFGDGASDLVETPSHTFENNGVNDVQFEVELISSSIYGCSDTAYGSVNVHPSPDANFVATPTSQLYPSATVSITNNSSNGNWDYAWDFGDANTSTLEDPTSHNYAYWGDYTISLTVSSPYCTDDFSQTIEIIPPIPIADFIGGGEGCRPLTLQFLNNSTYEQTYSWDFGDGGTSTSQNPTYTYYNAGTYTVKLTVTGEGGQDTEVKTDIVVVNENAIAYFDLSPKYVVIPNQAVEFYNFSSYADAYQWNFGDGATSELEFPEHYYTVAGTYDVQLVANNNENCPDTFLLVAAVFAEAAGEIEFPNAFTPNTSGGNGGTYDPRSFNNDVFFPVHDGVIDYHLQIFSRWGELMFESFDVNTGWDGYYNGVLCQQDVYVWKVKAKFSNGKENIQAGDVTLIR